MLNSATLMVLKELFKLVPFLLSVCIYFVLVPQSSCPIWLKVFLKCLPILFLCMYILTLGEHVSTHSKAPKLLAGLLLSAAGDTFRTLSTHQYHVHSDYFFGLTHVCYIWMFGLKPLNLPAAFFLVVIGTVYLLFLSRCLWDEKPQPLHWVAYIYISLIGIMAWRASAETLFNQHWSCVKLFATIGGMLLLVSHFTYAVSVFCFPVYNSGFIVATYYVAQMLITVSAVNSGNTVVKNRK